MFFRHMRDCRTHRREHGAEGFSHKFGRHGRGGGFGREKRVFDSGEMRLVILALIAQKPRHGYEIIKALAERVGDDYSPSPGVVYPTLTLLEEMGYASAGIDEGGRKLYTLTPAGQKQFEDNKPQIDAIFSRFARADEDGRTASASVMRALWNLRAAVKLRLRSRSLSREQFQAIADALDAAAKAIERS